MHGLTKQKMVQSHGKTKALSDRLLKAWSLTWGLMSTKQRRK